MRIYRGHTHQHQQVVIKYWQRVISSPPMETVEVGNFLTESSPLAERFLCKPVRRWASHRRAPATTTRRAPQIWNGSFGHSRKMLWAPRVDKLYRLGPGIHGVDSAGQRAVSAFSTGVSHSRLGRTSTSRPQHSGRGCVMNGETTDDL